MLGALLKKLGFQEPSKTSVDSHAQAAKSTPKSTAKVAAKAPAKVSVAAAVKAPAKPVAKPLARPAKKAVVPAQPASKVKPVVPQTPAKTPAKTSTKTPTKAPVKPPTKAPVKASTPAANPAAVKASSKVLASPSKVAKATPKAEPKAAVKAADAAPAKAPAASAPASKTSPKAAKSAPVAAPTPTKSPQLTPVSANPAASATPAPAPGRRGPGSAGKSKNKGYVSAPDSAQWSKPATYMSSMTLTPAPTVVHKRDPKRANNWKTVALDRLEDEDIMAMPEGEYMNATQLAFFRLRLSRLKHDMLTNAGETTEHLREDTVVVPDPADRATIEEEHALELRTRDRERKLLKKIEQSIGRIDADDYGYCDETGEPIGVPRLLARPTASLSLEAQQRRELRQKMFGD